MSEWIDIEEKQPRAAEPCLIAAIDPDGARHLSCATWQGKHFYLTAHRAYWIVTHWMPLPPVPEEKE